MGWTDDLKGALFGSGPTSTPVWVDSAGDYRVEVTDAQGRKSYRMPTEAERNRDGGAYTKKEAERKNELLYQRGLIAKQEQKSDQRFEAETAERNRQFGLQQGQLQNQTTALQNQNALGLAQIAHSGEVLKQTAADNRAAREQSGNQFAAQMALQTEQIRNNNKLLDRRLTLEDDHFRQKMEYDKRLSRRAQVISSLSLVAQSLARL